MNGRSRTSIGKSRTTTYVDQEPPCQRPPKPRRQVKNHHTVGKPKDLVDQELSGPVLRDTARLSQRYPPIARYGVFGVSTWPIGCDTPSPFSERFPLGEHSRSGGAIAPPQKGYLSDTCAIPYENKAKGCDTPLCDTILKGYCAIWGGISHWTAKIKSHHQVHQ